MKSSWFILLLAIHAAMGMPANGQAAVEKLKVEGVVAEQDSQQQQEEESALADQYFTKKPSSFLNDPQSLLSSQEREQLETLLSNHAADSTIDLYVFLFGENQKLPQEGKNKDYIARHFSEGKPVVALHYYFGNPNRTEIFLSPSIAKVVSSTEQQRSVQSSVIRAMRANGSFEQLEEFLIQYSVRTYWMERMMFEASGVTAEVVSVDEVAEVKIAKEKMNLLEMIPENLKQPALISASCFVVTLGLWGLIILVRSRSRYKFPEFDVESRLGGSHAAGIGAVVSFASPAVSPARQREQVPEYLRRA